MFPKVINSLELVVSTVTYSFDPCFRVKALLALSTAKILTESNSALLLILKALSLLCDKAVLLLKAIPLLEFVDVPLN